MPNPEPNTISSRTLRDGLKLTDVELGKLIRAIYTWPRWSWNVKCALFIMLSRVPKPGPPPPP